MSTYNKITRHPQTGKYEWATWIDDYYGHHIYGVRFDSDKKVYPTELVYQKQILNFWADDVIAAFDITLPHADKGDLRIEFLNNIDTMYKDRWARDADGGEGARDWYRSQKINTNEELLKTLEDMSKAFDTGQPATKTSVIGRCRDVLNKSRGLKDA